MGPTGMGPGVWCHMQARHKTRFPVGYCSCRELSYVALLKPYVQYRSSDGNGPPLSCWTSTTPRCSLMVTKHCWGYKGRPRRVGVSLDAALGWLVLKTWREDTGDSRQWRWWWGSCHHGDICIDIEEVKSMMGPACLT